MSLPTHVLLQRASRTLATFTFVAVAAHATAQATDPRVGLGAGWLDAKSASRNMTLISHTDRPEGFFNAQNLGDFGLINSDMAFRGNILFQGNFNGFQIYDMSNLKKPVLKKAFVCPGGQGDPSVWGNLLFISVEATNGRIDCGTQGVTDTVSAERFRGVRIFDISNLDAPKQVAFVQTCRGSHTHTLVPDPHDKANMYVYVSGTSVVRSGAELAGCNSRKPEEDSTTALFRIDIIKVPLAAPQNAKIVNSPRVFANNSSGALSGLWHGGDHGAGTQTTSETDQCHDITVYPEIGLAAGACSGNGILLDIKDPEHPKRIDEVLDPNFAYWHSATFNNAGTKVLFTDEWGGGTQAKCRASDKPEWGADAIFTITNGKMKQAGYYKLPAPQTEQENCVAHNGSLIPVPGRDILVQGWYQGGLSVVDFTNAAKPVELAFFDRGPMSATTLFLSGMWAGYWYNGHIYGSEIGRGLDVFELQPSNLLSKNEIEAASLIHVDTFNPQLQKKIVWPAHFSVARSYVDQLMRNKGVAAARLTAISAALDGAEKMPAAGRRTALTTLATELDKDAATASDAARVRALSAAVKALATAAR